MEDIGLIMHKQIIRVQSYYVESNAKKILRNIEAATRVSVDNSLSYNVPFLRRWLVYNPKYLTGKS